MFSSQLSSYLVFLLILYFKLCIFGTFWSYLYCCPYIRMNYLACWLDLTWKSWSKSGWNYDTILLIYRTACAFYLSSYPHSTSTFYKWLLVLLRLFTILTSTHVKHSYRKETTHIFTLKWSNCWYKYTLNGKRKASLK